MRFNVMMPFTTLSVHFSLPVLYTSTCTVEATNRMAQLLIYNFINVVSSALIL